MSTSTLVESLGSLPDSRSLSLASRKKPDAQRRYDDPNTSAFHSMWRELARYEDGSKDHNVASVPASLYYNGETEAVYFYPVSRTQVKENVGIIGEVSLPDYDHPFRLHIIYDLGSEQLHWEELPAAEPLQQEVA